MISIQENISLQKYTTFDIGGEARYFVSVKNVEELQGALKFARKKNLKYFILAGGSNILFSDDGFDGLVIKMDISEIKLDKENLEIVAGAGVVLLDLIKTAAENGLAGMENMTGIPGTVGGAIRGNAEAFKVQANNVVLEVAVLDTKTNEIKTFINEECQFAYRSSIFKTDDNFIILNATFKFTQGEQGEIEKVMEEIVTKRNKLQLQDIKSAGSFFTNPVVNEEVQKLFEDAKNVHCRNGRVPAGWLLDEVGLLQKKIGSVGTGDKHANYFINYGGGTFDQVLQLSSLAKSRVRDKFGVQLNEEVKIIC